MNARTPRARAARAKLIVYALMLLALGVPLLVGLSGCTFAVYQDQAGRELVLADLRLGGSAVNVEVTRPDGTKVAVTRDQASPADTVEAAAELINPARGLLP